MCKRFATKKITKFCRLPLPDLIKCCFCVKDLRVAVCIIAVLAIITSPAVTWVIVRHSYVLRISSFLSADSEHPDVTDMHFNNILSFGFGANSGIGPSCLTGKGMASLNKSRIIQIERQHKRLVAASKACGWFLFILDLAFITFSFLFLKYMFSKDRIKMIVYNYYFMLCALLMATLSFIYGMIYVSTCFIVGQVFPIFDFIFSCCDYSWWLYLILIVNSFRNNYIGSGSSDDSIY